jgi:hypothetical protein
VTALATAALIAAAAWLAALTVMVLAMVRQVGLLTSWAQNSHDAGTAAEAGLNVGEELPASVGAISPDLASGLAYVVFLGGNCQPCREFASEAGRATELKEPLGPFPILAAITGADREADEIVRNLPSWFGVVTGEDAATLTNDFEVRSTPYVYEVEGNAVTGRAIAGYGIVNLLNLVDARETSDAAEFAGKGAGVLQVQHRTAMEAKERISNE